MNRSRKRVTSVLLGGAFALIGAGLEVRPALSNDRVGSGELCRVGNTTVAACESGHTCRPANNYGRRYCARSPNECSIPNPGRDGLRVGGKSHVHGIAGVPAGQYVCIDPPGADIPKLFPEVSAGRCQHTDQCRLSGHECIRRSKIESPGGTQVTGHKYCQLPSKCSGGYSNGARFTSGGNPWVCHANATTGGVWVKPRPNGKKAASKSGNVYATVYGRNVSSGSIGKYCHSGIAKRWVESSHWYCVSSDEKCAYPNTNGKNVGHEVSVGGKKYRCQGAHGWRRADGEACAVHGECGILSRCSAGPGSTGKFCRSSFKKCAWPGLAGLTAGQTKRHGNRFYRCQSNGTYKFVGRKPSY